MTFPDFALRPAASPAVRRSTTPSEALWMGSRSSSCMAAVHTVEDLVPVEFAREFQAANIYVPLPEESFW
jgi:hypothetical protein